MKKLSFYEKGHTCSVCGCHIKPNDTYSAKPPYYKPVCPECDVDLHVPQKVNEE